MVSFWGNWQRKIVIEVTALGGTVLAFCLAQPFRVTIPLGPVLDPLLFFTLTLSLWTLDNLIHPCGFYLHLFSDESLVPPSGSRL